MHGNMITERFSCVAKKLKRPLFPSFMASPDIGVPILISPPQWLSS